MAWKKLTLLTLILFAGVACAAALIAKKFYTRPAILELQREEFLKGKQLHQRLYEAGVK